MDAGKRDTLYGAAIDAAADSHIYGPVGAPFPVSTVPHLYGAV